VLVLGVCCGFALKQYLTHSLLLDLTRVLECTNSRMTKHWERVKKVIRGVGRKHLRNWALDNLKDENATPAVTFVCRPKPRARATKTPVKHCLVERTWHNHETGYATGISADERICKLSLYLAKTEVSSLQR
jgi:hypothetical protein